MTESQKLKFLKIALIFFGLICIFGIFILSKVWPSGWVWHHSGRSYYFEMIMGVYATLGVFMLLAAKDPHKHLSLIWFVIISSLVHGLIMAVQSFDGEHNMGHLYGDVPALFLAAIILGYLSPKRLS
ncbi:MAG: hypothetical protein HWE16_07315 [Gammaproteobacteria bacterium]|nr:hypothetical protein [Gammaproteobacteria bacterium]